MADEMPASEAFTGLSRKVIAYSEAFQQIVKNAKAGSLGPGDWDRIEQLVDVGAYRRLGVFATPQAEVLDWQTYKSYISRYAGATSWEGTLRHITEQPGRVILELEERNTVNGKTDVSNTVTIYGFDAAEKLVSLEVYVMHLPER